MSEIAKLQVITQDHPHISHAQQAQSACQGGARWIQFRMKEADNAVLIEEASKVREICKRFGAILIVNDHPWLAKAVGADGVHLGKEDMSPLEARELLGKDSYIIGGTANALEDVKKLCSMQVDYIGLGPFRFTTTKKRISPVLGAPGILSIVAGAAADGNFVPPIVAIGGIVPADIPDILSTGIHGVAVSSAINLAPDPARAAAGFLHAFKQPTIVL